VDSRGGKTLKIKWVFSNAVKTVFFFNLNLFIYDYFLIVLKG
jgi:hypothetical protein